MNPIVKLSSGSLVDAICRLTFEQKDVLRRWASRVGAGWEVSEQRLEKFVYSFPGVPLRILVHESDDAADMLRLHIFDGLEHCQNV